MLDDQKAEAQQALDELWSEKLIPFQLNVGKITKDQDEYAIHFYDRRMRIAPVPVIDGHLFKEMVRAAVLDRVAKMSGPLRNSAKKGSK